MKIIKKSKYYAEISSWQKKIPDNVNLVMLLLLKYVNRPIINVLNKLTLPSTKTTQTLNTSQACTDNRGNYAAAKDKKQYLRILEVNRYCLLALHGSVRIDYDVIWIDWELCVPR